MEKSQRENYQSAIMTLACVIVALVDSVQAAGLVLQNCTIS